MRFRNSNRRSANRRTGLSLLEVILSIAILGGSLVVIGELVSLGYDHARATKLRTEANVICNATLAEVAAGVLPLEGVNSQGVETNPSWQYTIAVENSEQPGLMVVTVNVQQVQPSNRNPILVSATRFMVDPDYEPEEEEEENLFQ